MAPKKSNKCVKTLFERISFQKLTELKSCKGLQHNFRAKSEVETLCGLIDAGNDQLKVEYSLSFAAKKSKRSWGRLYANVGLQRMSKWLRRVLAHECYYDVDIVNACFAILEGVCNLYNIPCEKLTHFNKNRDEVLNSLHDDRGEAKQMVYCCLYNACRFDDPYLDGLARCLTFVTKTLFEHPDFEDVRQYASCELAFSDPVKDSKKDKKKKKKKESKKATESRFVSLLIEKIECKLLGAMEKFFHEKSIRVGTLLFDGMFVEKDGFEDDVEVTLNECTTFVWSETGYRIQLRVKPLNITEEDKVRVQEIPFLGASYVETIDKKHISIEDIPDARISVIVSPPGTGKTTVISKYLGDQNPSNFLIISYRRSLLSNNLAFLTQNGVDVISYKDSERFQESVCRGVQYDSLVKVQMETITDKTVVYLDEASALINYMATSTTFQNQRSYLYRVFEQVIKGCGKIIVTDADMNRTTLNYLEKLCKCSAKVVHNIHPCTKHINLDKKEPQLVVELIKDGTDEVLGEIEDKIKEHNVVIVTDRLKHVKILKETLGSDNNIKYYSRYHGDTGELDEGADACWQDKSVCYNSTIETGVDFHGEARHVFGFFTGVVSARSFVQMLERSRKKLSLKIAYKVSGEFNHLCNFSFVQELRNTFENSLRESGRLCNHLSGKEENILIKANPIYKTMREQITERLKIPFTPTPNMIMESMLRDAWERNNAVAKLGNRLKEIGYQVKWKVAKKKFNNDKSDDIEEREVEHIRQALLKTNGNALEPHIEKRMDEIKENGERLRTSAAAAADENKYLWELLSSKDGLKRHAKIRVYMDTCEENETELVRIKRTGGDVHSLKQELQKVLIIKYIESVLGLKSIFTVNHHHIQNQIENREHLEPFRAEFIDHVKTTFPKCKAANGHLGTPKPKWEDVYKALRKYWTHYFSNELVRFDSTQKENQRNRYTISIPDPDVDKFKVHRELISRLKGVNKLEKSEEESEESEEKRQPLSEI
eukprot:CAMPEP_0184019180 /NCGR_PEP_ID=MMETSP0954-20121128/8599_1 /TAXON_ID=627963 /ORGANISM="Aplanochytrium sp, Strain PBS07" /LENGTH=997 /DNA_ID=CAMNT_0026300799 /DNA_START=120 /DNA_END=3113 /DNA_ORIENTATION=+